jgi:hypothetical protein
MEENKVMAMHSEVVLERPMWTWDRNLGFVPTDPYTVEGAFQNDSTNNHWFRRKGNRFTGDRGSDWTALKCEVSAPETTAWVSSDHRRGYKGPHVVAGSNSETRLFDAEDFLGLDLPYSDELQLLSYGSTAISRCLPTSPVVDMPVAFAELFREGVPNYIGRQLLNRRSVSASQLSGEYLNYEFGIRPFLADLEAFWHATRRAKELLRQFANNSGKLIRRRYNFDPYYEQNTVTSVEPDAGGAQHFLEPNRGIHYLPDFGGSWGTREITTTRFNERWFSGAFTYYLPGVGDDIWSNLERDYAEMRYLYGGFGVSTVWNLIPFSWAADWVTNVGDVLTNIDRFANDGLVMPYGYVMERSEVRVDRTVRDARLGNVDPNLSIPVPDEVKTSLRIVSMRRRKATPYAFGLDQSEFTDRQWAIIGALGLSFTSH